MSVDEGYVGFMLGIDQMKKRLAEKDKEIERLKGVIAEIAAILATGEEFPEDDVFTLCKDTIGEKQILDRYNKKLRERASKLGKDTNAPTNDTDINAGSMEK